MILIDNKSLAKITLLSVLIALGFLLGYFILLSAQAEAPPTEKFLVTLDIDKSQMTHKTLYITVQNLQDSSDNLDLKTILNSTDFDVADVRSVMFARLEEDVPYKVTTPVYENRSYECWKYDNKTMQNVSDTCWHMVQTGSREETMYKDEWVSNALIDKTEDSRKGELRHRWEQAAIQKAGLAEATLKFKLEFDHPIVERPGGWGSQGILWLDVNGREYVDLSHSSWWNKSCSYYKNITVTENSGTGLSDYPVVVINFSTNTHQSDGKDMYVINSTGNSISYGLQRNASDNFTMAFKVNLGANSNTNVSVYYGCGEDKYNNISWNSARYNIYDDFLGTSLSSDWLGSSHFTYSVGESKLNVSDMDTPSPEWTGAYAIYQNQIVEKNVGFIGLLNNMEWVSGGYDELTRCGIGVSNSASWTGYAPATDPGGIGAVFPIVSISMTDAWGQSYAGTKAWTVNGSGVAGGAGSLPTSGTITAKLQRFNNGTINVYWDDIFQGSGQAKGQMVNVSMFFSRLSQPYTFGNFKADEFIFYKDMDTNPPTTYLGAEQTYSGCNGTLQVNLIEPTGNIEVVRHQNFTLKANAMCVGDCCGLVNATADPRAMNEIPVEETNGSSQGLLGSLIEMLRALIQNINHAFHGR